MISYYRYYYHTLLFAYVLMHVTRPLEREVGEDAYLSYLISVLLD